VVGWVLVVASIIGPATQPVAATCTFPGALHRCSSPRTGATVEWRDATDTHGHELWLRRGVRVERLLEFGRSVDLLWSQDGTALAITNHVGSDGSEVLVVRLEGPLHAVSVEEALNQALGRPLAIYRNGHRYFTALSWETARKLRFQVRAYDAAPDTEFVGQFSYELGGQVRSIAP